MVTRMMIDLLDALPKPRIAIELREVAGLIILAHDIVELAKDHLPKRIEGPLQRFQPLGPRVTPNHPLKMRIGLIRIMAHRLPKIVDRLPATCVGLGGL